MRRRALLRTAGALALAALGGGAGGRTRAAGPLQLDLERRAFDYFRDLADPHTGLVPDRWPTPSFASIAATGFGLTALPIGVQRGWITRAQAAERVHATLRFLHDAPQGPQPAGTIGHRGFFYHFLDPKTGMRFEQVELSTVDTALLVAGALFCGAWFDGGDARERAIRQLAEALYTRIDWRWAQSRPPAIGHGWRPESGPLDSDYRGYNEALLLYILALGSPTHPVDTDAWDAWCATYDAAWGTEYGQTHLRYPVLFVHQFPHCWLDLRGVPDAFMRRHGIDYFENTRRATLAQRGYAIANPEGWAGYGASAWGITACDGPLDVQREWGGRMRRFISYAGRGMGGAQRYDDGTIAPYGAASSLPFAPEVVEPTLVAMQRTMGEHILGRYGFLAFNRSYGFTDRKLTHGRIVPGFGWVDTDWLGIEVGPQLALMANHRDAVVWRAMRRVPHLRRGLLRAGFRGGWLGR